MMDTDLRNKKKLKIRDTEKLLCAVSILLKTWNNCDYDWYSPHFNDLPQISCRLRVLEAGTLMLVYRLKMRAYRCVK